MGYSSGHLNGSIQLIDNYYSDGSTNYIIEDGKASFASLREGSFRFGNSSSAGTAGNTAPGINERIRMDTDGLSFNGDTAAANCLDDYEEGTFQFSLANVNAPSYEARGGTYVKIGRYVFGHGTIGVSSGLDTSDGSGFQPTGLPFTATGEVAVTLGRYTNLLGGKAGSFRNVRNTGTGFILLEGNDSNIAYNECSSSGYLNFTFAYYTTS